MFVASGVATAFLPLWLAARGLTAADVGVVLGIASLMRVFVVPFWGRLSDRAGQRRQTLQLAGAIATAAALAYLVVYGFGQVLIVTIVQSAANAPFMPLADTLSLALAREGRLAYGPVRAVGSAAFMVSNVLSGPLIGAVGPRAVPLLLVASYAATALLARALSEAEAVPRLSSAFGGTRLLRHRAFLLTLGASALIQGSHAAYYGVATLHWRAHGLSDTIIGLLWAEGVVGETAFFVYGRRLAERIGPGGLTALAASAAIIRWTVTSQTTALAPLVAVQALHAATYAMQHLSAMLMLSRTVPPERAATAQSLHAALGTGAPTGLLLWISGALYDGTGSVFLWMAAIGGTALLLAPGLARAYRARDPA